MNALDLKEFLEQFSIEELKDMMVRVENMSFRGIILDLRDSFLCDNIAVDNNTKTLIIEF